MTQPEPGRQDPPGALTDHIPPSTVAEDFARLSEEIGASRAAEEAAHHAGQQERSRWEELTSDLDEALRSDPDEAYLLLGPAEPDFEAG